MEEEKKMTVIGDSEVVKTGGSVSTCADREAMAEQVRIEEAMEKKALEELEVTDYKAFLKKKLN